MPTPSLLIVPARFKTGKLYSQIPTSGAGDFTVTRNTEARRFGPDGLIASVASGIPRLDYYTSGGVTGCPALLVEPAATNLVPNGVGFNAATGVETSGVTDSPAVAISGTLVTKNEASGTLRRANQTFSASALASGTTYSVSRFFKYNGVEFTTTLEASSAGQWGNVGWIQNIVLSAASGVTIGSSTACTGSVENFGNGWYRVNVRVTTGATITGSATVNVLSVLPAALSTGQGFLTACPQLETGSVATSYIPTTAGTGSRSADVISVTGAVSGSIGQTEGTIYAEAFFAGGLSNRPTRVVMSISDGTNNNRVIFYIVNNSTTIQGFIQANASVILDSGASFVGVTSAKLALAYKSGDYALYVNGSVAASGTTAFSFTGTLSQVTIGSANTLFNNLINDRVRAVALYTTRLTNAELASLTAP